MQCITTKQYNRYSTVQYNTTQYNIYNTVQYNTYNTIQYNTIQYSTYKTILLTYIKYNPQLMWHQIILYASVQYGTGQRFEPPSFEILFHF